MVNSDVERMTEFTIKELQKEIISIKGSPHQYFRQIELYEGIVDLYELRIQQLENRLTEC